jgi:hypothetical protein
MHQRRKQLHIHCNLLLYTYTRLDFNSLPHTNTKLKSTVAQAQKPTTKRPLMNFILVFIGSRMGRSCASCRFSYILGYRFAMERHSDFLIS